MGLTLKRVISSGVHSPVYRWWVLFEFGQPSGHPTHTTIIPSILALFSAALSPPAGAHKEDAAWNEIMPPFILFQGIQY